MQELISKYKLALKNLTLAIDLLNLSYDNDELFPEEIDDIIQEAIIKRFEYNYDLAFSIMKNILANTKNIDTFDFGNVINKLFKMQLIRSLEDIETWIEIKQMRKISLQTYEPEIAEGLCKKIIAEYHQLFIDFEKTIENLESAPISVFLPKSRRI